MNKKEKIDELLKGKEYLICDYLYLRDYDEISKILGMKEWNNPKFQPLLTSSIWINNFENVKRKLNLKYWNNPKYFKLLTPTIFAITEKYISRNIELFEEYGISKFICTNSLRKNSIEQRILLDYLIENKIDLIIDNKLNPIINATKRVLKEKYNIDIKEIMNKSKKGRVLCKI